MSVLMTVSMFSCGNKTTESVNKTEEEKVVEEKVEEKKVDPKEEAKKKAGEKLQTLLKSLEEKGVQISGNRVKIGIHNGVCTAQGTLTVIEKTGIPARVQILEQPAERNADVNE